MTFFARASSVLHVSSVSQFSPSFGTLCYPTLTLNPIIPPFINKVNFNLHGK